MTFQPEDTRADMHPSSGGKWKKLLGKKRVFQMIMNKKSDKLIQRQETEVLKLQSGKDSQKVEGRILDFLPIQPNMVNYVSPLITLLMCT